MLSPLQPGHPRWMDTGATPSNAQAKQQQQQATPQHAMHMMQQHTSPHSAVMSPESGMHSASHGRRGSNGSAMQDTPSSHDLVSSHSQHNLCSATESSSSSSSSNANDDGSSVSSASVSPPAVEAQRVNHAFSFGAADSQRMEDVAGASATPTRLSQAQGQAGQQQQYESMQQHQHQTPSQMQQQQHQSVTNLPPHHSSTQHPHPSPSHASQHHPQQSNRPSVPNSPNLGSQPTPASHHSPSQHASNSATNSSSSASATPTAPSVAKRGQGFSCHHCKTHKMPELLLFCSNQSKKGPGKKRCRKKYCDSCLKRLYGHPADLPLQSAAAGFQCPACLGNCVCAGCERKATGGAAASTTGAAAAAAPNSAASAVGDGASVGSNESNPSPHPIHPPSHSHSHSHSAHSLNSARSSSPGPISLPPSNTSSPSRPVHLQQQKPTTPQGKIAKKRRTSQDLGTAGAAMALAEDGSAMDPNAAASSAAASSSVFGTTAPASAVHHHPPAHTRALSGDQAMLSSASFAPGGGTYGAFSSGSNNPALPPRSRGNSGQPPQSLTASPRLAVLTASGGSAGSRMIHLPPFALASPSGTSGGTLLSHPAGGSPLSSLVGLGPSSFASGAAAAFATHIQQQVQHAVQTAAAVHQTAAGGTGAGSMAMDTGALQTPELHLGSAALSSHSPSLNSSALGSSVGSSTMTGGAGGLSAPTSPFSTPRSNTRPLSAFSPVLGLAPGSACSEVSAGAGSMDIGAGHGGTSIANLSMPSPNVSPNLFKRTLLLGSGDSPAKSTTVPAASTPSVQAPVTSVSPPGELELMKVLANVACSTTAPATATGSSSTAVQVAAPTPSTTAAVTTNSASLPPAHPVRTDAASPKLSGFMASVSLLSPPHGTSSNNLLGGVGGVTGLMQLQQLPPSAASVGAPLGSSLGVIQAQLKVQHQMEVACLLQQQHQQLAELERLAIQQEQHQQWQQQQQQQQQIAARSSPLHSRMPVAPPVPIPVPLTKLESSPIPPPLGVVKLEPSTSVAGSAVAVPMADSQVIPPSAIETTASDGQTHK